MKNHTMLRAASTVVMGALFLTCLLLPIRSAGAGIREEQHIAIDLKKATTYMNEARDTGDDRYYTRAESSLNEIFKMDPSNYGALRVKAWVQSGRHRFSEALATAKQASAMHPADSSNYGVMVDSLIELGRYDEAVDAAQRMVDLKPGMASYSRIAYLRWLFGDPKGAEEMMRMAVEAGPPGKPETTWCIVQLGNEYFKQGRLDMAEKQYKHALTIDPSYTHALAAMGKVEAGRQNYATAIGFYRKATSKHPVHAYVIALGDLYRLTGDAKHAEEQFALVEKMAAVKRSNPETGLKMAIFYLDHEKRLPEALRLAKKDADSSQDIQAWDTLAWAYYKNRRHKEALTALKKALRLGTKDAGLFFHAGMIYYGSGDNDRAKKYLSNALSVNPYFDLTYPRIARSTLERIERVENNRAKPYKRSALIIPSLIMVLLVTVWAFRNRITTDDLSKNT